MPPLCRAAIRVTPRDHRVGGRVSVSADRGCCHPRLRDPLVLVLRDHLLETQQSCRPVATRWRVLFSKESP